MNSGLKMSIALVAGVGLTAAGIWLLVAGQSKVAGTRRVPSAEAETGAADGTRRVPAAFQTVNGYAKRQSLRVVSLAPSVTEILFALGCEDSLIGVTDTCDFPPAAKRIEQIGKFGEPNLEKLLALAPDLVIASGFRRPEDIEMLRGEGIRVLDVRIRDFAGLFDSMRRIGEATGRSGQADRIIAQMQAELDAVAARQAQGGQSHFPGQGRENWDSPRERPPRVFVEIWDHPLTTVGGPSLLDEAIRRAGGVNVAHALAQPYPRVNPEQVIEWNPDVIIVAYMNRKGSTALPLADRIGWGDIAAVKEGRILRDLPNDTLLRPGPRLVEGVKALALRLHPSPAATVSTDESPRTSP